MDVIFTKARRGFGRWVDVGQKIHFGSSYGCHMHLLVNKALLPDVSGLEEDKWYLLESNIPDEGEPIDVISQGHKEGVQIRDFNEVITYNKSIGNRVFLSRLKCNPWSDDPNKRSFIIAEMSKVWKCYYSCGYQKDAVAFGCSIFDTLIPMSQKRCNENNAVYCSNLISIIYRRLGIIRRLAQSGDQVAPQQLLADECLFQPPVEI